MVKLLSFLWYFGVLSYSQKHFLWWFPHRYMRFPIFFTKFQRDAYFSCPRDAYFLTPYILNVFLSFGRFSALTEAPFFINVRVQSGGCAKAEWAEKCQRVKVIWDQSTAHSALTEGTFRLGHVMCLSVPSVKAEWAEKFPKKLKLFQINLLAILPWQRLRFL